MARKNPVEYPPQPSVFLLSEIPLGGHTLPLLPVLHFEHQQYLKIIFFSASSLMQDSHFTDVAPSSEMDLEGLKQPLFPAIHEFFPPPTLIKPLRSLPPLSLSLFFLKIWCYATDANVSARPFSKINTRRESPNVRRFDGADLLLLDDDIAMILDSPSPKRVASTHPDSDVEMSASEPPRRKRRMLINHRTVTSAPQQQKNNPAPLQHRQRRRLIHRTPVASEDNLNDDIDMESILKGRRATSRQGSVGSEASISAADDTSTTAATSDKPKPSRRRRLRPQNTMVVPPTATWRTIPRHETLDVADDEDTSGTFTMSNGRDLGVGQNITCASNPIQPIVLGTTGDIQQHPPSSYTAKRGRRRRQMRTEAMAEKLDRFAQHQDLVDLSQHLYIPTSVSSQQLAANSHISKHPIIVRDDDDDDDDEEDAENHGSSPLSPEGEVDDDVMVIESDHHQEYHSDVNRMAPTSQSPKQSNEALAVAQLSSPGSEEIEQQQQVLHSEPVNTRNTMDTHDVAQPTTVAQAAIPSEQDDKQATYIGRVIGSVSKFFLGY
ncbi:hypothetical protein BX666DRAFT_896226 [Dichotomocladium elegans]|nr:hypothetical protein BX666DRAFT_896226 [Dichotomocladium elegans]